MQEMWRPAADRRRVPPFIERLLSFGADPADSPDLRQIKRIVVGALWVSLGPNMVSAGVLYAQDADWAGSALVAIGLLVFSILVALRRWPKAWPSIFHLLIAGNVAVSIALTLLFGGIAESGTNFIWGFAGLLAAVVVFRDRRVLYWLIAFAAIVIVTAIAAGGVTPRYRMDQPVVGTISNLLIVGSFTFLVLLYFIRQRDELRKQSDDLLRNVLPDEIADRLLESGDRIADHFDDTSILFADLVGFTPMSATMSPSETVDFLNEVFSAFDAMVEERGLEKIKTVGDEYMVAAGVPVRRVDHAHALADLALAMRDYARVTTIGGRPIAFRMGINSGPVVAGIIGTKRFAYDLWGDAVNTASRMESHGFAGEIQITGATYDLIKDDFDCRERGTIDIKGKGPVPVWFLSGRR